MEVKQLNLPHNKQQPRSSQTAPSVWGKIDMDPSRSLCKFNSWAPLIKPESCRSKRGRRGGLFFFFPNHHLLLEHRPPND